MRCGMILNKLLTPLRPPTGDLFGSLVAEGQLIEATLDASPAIVWDLIQSEALDVSGDRSPHSVTSSSAYKRFPERIGHVQASGLARIASRGSYIFITSAPGFSRLAEFRVQAGLSHVPICCLVHSLNTWSYETTYESILLHADPFDVVVASSPTAHRALTTTFSELSAKLTHRFRMPHSVQAPRIVDIPFGVSPSWREAEPDSRLRDSLGIPPERFIALYLGRLSETYKADLDILLRAISVVSRECHHIHLVLAGQVDNALYVQHLREHASLLGITDHLTVVENFPEFVKPQLLECANVVVLPADCIQETFGIAVLEGMAFAKPVIASSWSGYRDLIVHGETGFLIATAVSSDQLAEVCRVWPLYDARSIAAFLSRGTCLSERDLIRHLSGLARNPAEAARMGVAGRQRVLSQYTWATIAQRFCRLWEEQLETALSTPLPEPLKPFPYDRVFSDYADDHIDSHSRIQVSPLRGGHYNAKELSRECAAILQQLEKHIGSASIQQLKEEGASLSNILWLLKRGYCEAITPYES